MQKILRACTDLDTIAQATYESMASHAQDPELMRVFKQLAAEERSHVLWWKKLADAWDRGLVPDIISDTEGLEQHLAHLLAEVKSLLPVDFSTLDEDQMLEIAARMEFFMTDSAFGELLDLAEPRGARSHREAYARHLENVIGLIETRYSRSDLGRFFAGVIRRTWRDNLTLAKYATHDPLTSLHNRRSLLTQLEQWISWAKRYKRPLGLLFVDIDDFKKVNDTFGHGIGDLALKAVASSLAHTVRSSDVVGRYGGDEFAIVAPEAESEELIHLAVRLIDAVSTLDLKDLGKGAIPLSISVGGAVLKSTDGIDSDFEHFLAAADNSLYEAKRAGKARTGQIVVFPVASASN